MKKLFYIRHGLTDHNQANLFSGRSDVKLTQTGENQAIKAGLDANKNLPLIDLIISSPLKRALITAELIAKELGYPMDKIEAKPLFIERGYGVLEGTKTKDFFDYHKPEELDNVRGVETAEHLHKRAVQAFKYLLSRQEDNILVISHGSFGNAFICNIRKVPYSYAAFDKEPKNGEIVELI